MHFCSSFFFFLFLFSFSVLVHKIISPIYHVKLWPNIFLLLLILLYCSVLTSIMSSNVKIQSLAINFLFGAYLYITSYYILKHQTCGGGWGKGCFHHVHGGDIALRLNFTIPAKILYI